jgi:hypothetical protein
VIRLGGTIDRERRVVDLTRTGGTDAGLKELTPLRSLTRLDLAGTGVTGAGVATLRSVSPACRVVRCEVPHGSWTAGMRCKL